MKSKTKKSIVVLIVLLSIGFAAVTATLTINGIIHIGVNNQNYNENVKFTRADLTYSDATKTASTGTISEDGKGISFETEALKNIGEYVTLTYDVTNNSQYVAEFTGVTCTVTNEEGTDVTDAVTNGTEYITLDYTKNKDTENNNAKIAANGGVLAGETVKVTLRKSYVGTAASEGVEAKNTTNYTVRCELANQISK